MTKLSEVPLDISPTTRCIYDHYKKSGDCQRPRGYLGASIIGHSCERYLWYTFRACCLPPFDGRMYRLFSTGEREESRVCSDLQSIGCACILLDENSEQFAISFLGGHFAGHLDGVVKGIPEAPTTWHVLECKTHNTKSFNKLKQDGVKSSKSAHYAQMQIYMHGTGMTRALYFAVCKETDEIYTERVRYDKDEAAALLERAERIIRNPIVPERISSRSDYYECKWCDAHDICHGCEKALPLPSISCKQCCYATPVTTESGAKWKCEKLEISSSNLQPCSNHLCLPGLFPYAIPTDCTDGLICFKNKDDGKEWNHGGFDYSTKDLMAKTREEL